MSRVADVWGADVADALAKWAIDALMYPPADIATYSTRLPATEVRRGRAILGEAGFDWRAFKLERDAGRSQRASDREKTS